MARAIGSARWAGLLAAVPLLFLGCAYTAQMTFPAPDQLFVTTGDGNIARPYTPVGQFFYVKQGFRLSFLPILGMIPIADVDPSSELRTEISRRVRAMGGDALINMRIDFAPPRNGFLGLFASGGRISMTGTVIRR